ncbi:MAG: cation diffusion facilitator family transporter [Alphaproteobacteria bacterium]|nr:cation diffusion facilitator family transporter [Alphaproteobacteria bacterium]
MPDAVAEQRILKLSIGVTIVLALFGLAFGLVSGSLSIVFDGVFSVIDAAMSGLALFVSRLVTRQTENRRFQFGFWHIEPMVLAFNGGTLMLLCFYAFVNAIGSFLAGGRQLAFDWAMAYAVVVCAGCFGMYFYQRRANRRIGSDFVQLDAQSWLMSALITSALLVAFLAAIMAKGTSFDPWLPYVDPVVLAVLSLCLIFVPVRTVRRALTEILLITPPDLDEHVRSVMKRVVEEYRFLSFTSYVAKVGRAQFIEIHIAVNPKWPVDSVATADAVRREIAEALGGEGPDRWLTIDFTADPHWL